MDILAHGLWSFAVFHNSNYVWVAILFGVLPDVLSFGILFMINLFRGNLHRGPPALNTIPKWVLVSYNLTHSLIVFIFIFTFAYLISKSWYWPMLAWAIHIAIDIPTHSKKFFPTPFLWPVSDYRFDGISWPTPWFMRLNYGSLVIVFALIFFGKF